jgi:hypothetical protein
VGKGRDREGWIPPPTRNRRNGLIACLLLILTAGKARAEGWINVRVPTAVHFGPPGRQFESGLHADALVLSDHYQESRFGIGPYAELRTLGLSHLGVGGGVEALMLAPGRTALGVGAEAGFSNWFNVGNQSGLSADFALSLQLRSSGARGGFVQTSALFGRCGRFIDGGPWEFTTGLQIGGDPIFSVIALFMQHSGW